MQTKLPDLNGDSASKAKPSFRMLNLDFCCLPPSVFFLQELRGREGGGGGGAEGESNVNIRKIVFALLVRGRAESHLQIRKPGFALLTGGGGDRIQVEDVEIVLPTWF